MGCCASAPLHRRRRALQWHREAPLEEVWLTPSRAAAAPSADESLARGWSAFLLASFASPEECEALLVAAAEHSTRATQGMLRLPAVDLDARAQENRDADEITHQ